MTDSSETFRDCRTTISLWSLKVSNLYTTPYGCYGSSNGQNRMCELCTFSQIRSPIFMPWILLLLCICMYHVHAYKYICTYIWKEYINSACSKTKQLKHFAEKSYIHCTKHVKFNCYKTLLRSVLEYATTVWSPFTQYDKLVGYWKGAEENSSICYE